ncbi:TetR/AcrR family transcriptional regulator [Tsukamurella ocularis]|uniref:TetR/AcrR family transcriptional regulator n=1 Tax=Tsukamurella ocularis TaxID=1970234 RepID=UPI002168B794|nr:TetR/AcrR family transcriptional regulator [Tsukamurella ocularis]MCS3782290.1 AcrR family transcriptional regulator [Tsukamurella ocularis]MCS3789550.1 AcrR family transcriptional regulator [Tsukamurella ocularis]MCS3852697.1 AcrR family transcriptional regulator [Tsukamurella ocularis]
MVTAGAALADEVGIDAVTFALLAERLGVKPPALYKHVDSVGDLRRRIATLAMTELGDEVGVAIQGRSRAAAMAALVEATQSYIGRHPGRYASTTGIAMGADPDDPFLRAATRVMQSLRAVVSGYGVAAEELDHAIRTLRCTMHGFAVLQAVDAFQWENDSRETATWMVRFLDAGLSGLGGAQRGDPRIDAF